MDGGDHGRAAQLREGEWQPIEMVVNKVEVGGATQGMSNVERLPHPPVQTGVLLVGTRTDPVELRPGQRIEGCEEGYVQPALDQAVGQQPGDELHGP